MLGFTGAGCDAAEADCLLAGIFVNSCRVGDGCQRGWIIDGGNGDGELLAGGQVITGRCQLVVGTCVGDGDGDD